MQRLLHRQTNCAPNCAPNCGARTFVRLARRIFERFCASAISRAASSSSRSSVFIGASFGARFIVDSSGAFGAGFTAAFGVRTGSGSFFASSDFVVFEEFASVFDRSPEILQQLVSRERTASRKPMTRARPA